ncbi:cytochrome P450 6B5-like [Aricia agestis]|uniref:cytochrome P450 6B5-like n=1 Tax=Aricia agestis TaxID=91739 RepID=UPI001C204F1E|nr:cytochrome P450 6B5-like [Aricia agestis]
MIIQAIIIILLAVIIYLKGVFNERYWKMRGVVFYQRNKVFGVAWDCLMKNRAYFEHFHEIYKRFPNEPAVGLGSVLKPTIFLRDLENIQHVMVTDFNAFNHKGIEVIEEDVLANNLFIMNGKKWKVVRQKMNPLFTPSKLKSMFGIIDKSARDIVPYIKNNKTNTFETLSTFCSAAKSAIVFGTTTESIFDSPFLKMAQKVSQPTFAFYLKFIVSVTMPILIRVFKIKIFNEFEEFFVGAIKKLLQSRQNENIKSHEFADLCLSIKDGGLMKEDDLEVEPTDELLAAQAFFFFAAGVEPTATGIFNTLVLLGQNPDVLKRLHEEIDNAFEENEGSISYDLISNMEYLDMVFSEASRFYPPIGYLMRECVKDSILPAGNIKIDKGTTVFLPIYSIHHDEIFYSDPEVFNPERFSRENKAGINEKAYITFGKGNRICIGMRYAILQAKAGIVQLLRHFIVKTTFEEGVKFKKDQLQVRLENVDVEFIERTDYAGLGDVSAGSNGSTVLN